MPKRSLISPNFFIGVAAKIFPVLAVGLATTVNSVVVYDALAGSTAYYSYFDPIPVANLQTLPSLAALLSVVSGVLAAIYLAKKRAGLLKACGYVAFASAVAASIPVAIRGDVMVIPNAGLPIFMLAEYAVSYFVGKLPEKEEKKPKAPKLKRR